MRIEFLPVLLGVFDTVEVNIESGGGEGTNDGRAVGSTVIRFD